MKAAYDTQKICNSHAFLARSKTYSLTGAHRDGVEAVDGLVLSNLSDEWRQRHAPPALGPLPQLCKGLHTRLYQIPAISVTRVHQRCCQALSWCSVARSQSHFMTVWKGRTQNATSNPCSDLAEAVQCSSSCSLRFQAASSKQMRPCHLCAWPGAGAVSMSAAARVCADDHGAAATILASRVSPHHTCPQRYSAISCTPSRWNRMSSKIMLSGLRLHLCSPAPPPNSTRLPRNPRRIWQYNSSQVVGRQMDSLWSLSWNV